MERELSKEKKYELLNLYSSSGTLLFSGLFSGVTLVLIFLLIMFLFSFFVGSNVINTGKFNAYDFTKRNVQYINEHKQLIGCSEELKTKDSLVSYLNQILEQPGFYYKFEKEINPQNRYYKGILNLLPRIKEIGNVKIENLQDDQKSDIIRFNKIVLLNLYPKVFAKMFTITSGLNNITIFYLVIFFAFTGMISARLTRVQYMLQFPLVYFFFVFLIGIGVFIIFIGMDYQQLNRLATEKLNFESLNINFWVAILISSVFLSFVMANPLKQLWQVFYNIYIELLSEVDYKALHNEDYFYTQLREAIYNSRRYQLSFVVSLFKVENFYSIKNEFSRRIIAKMENDMLHLIAGNIRETDIVGFLGNGEFYGILLYTTLDNSRKASERLKEMLEKNILIKSQGNMIKLSFHLWAVPSEEAKDVEFNIREAISPGKKEQIKIIKI